MARPTPEEAEYHAAAVISVIALCGAVAGIFGGLIGFLIGHFL